MSRLETILLVVSSISILINIGLVVYTRIAISKLLLVSEELGDLQDMIDSFLNHIGVIYEMEMFYGDQTLESLLEHARDFSEQMSSFEYIYSLTDEEEVDQVEEQTEEEPNYDD